MMKLGAGLIAIIIAVGNCCMAGPVSSIHFDEAVKAAAQTDPAMGDWQGVWILKDGPEQPLMAQVINWGQGGKYQVNLISEFDTRNEPLAVLNGQKHGDAIRFARSDGRSGGLKWEGAIENDVFAGRLFDQDKPAGKFELHKVYRISPTLGVKPPKGAIVLFDGSDMKAWKLLGSRGWQVADGIMTVSVGAGSIISKQKFNDFKLHLEFRTPFKPDARGQGRGNSGVYMQGRYEVQVLDSYGLAGRNNECGGIYSVAAPRVNMCAPPMQWQTYDITFHGARLVDGNKQNARITVYHNDTLIHDNQEVGSPTTAAPVGPGTSADGIYLQDHGNPVQYRNIWVLPLD